MEAARRDTARTMSDENIEVLRRADDAFQRGDLTAVLADMDEGVTASRVAPMPDIKTYEGHKGITQMLLDWVEGFDDFAMSAAEYIDVNDRQVVVRVQQRAQGTQSRVPIEADFWFLYTFRNRKVMRLGVYLSKHPRGRSAERSPESRTIRGPRCATHRRCPLRIPPAGCGPAARRRRAPSAANRPRSVQPRAHHGLQAVPATRAGRPPRWRGRGRPWLPSPRRGRQQQADDGGDSHQPDRESPQRGPNVLGLLSEQEHRDRPEKVARAVPVPAVPPGRYPRL